MSLLELPLDIGLTPEILMERMIYQPLLVGYLNPLAWMISKRDPGFRDELSKLDVVTCDGIAVRHAATRLCGYRPEIISLDWSGIARRYLELFRERKYRIVLVGGHDGVAARAADHLRSEWDGIRIVGAFEGYDEGPDRASEWIAANHPDVVLAGMGMGQQEPYLLQLRSRGWNGTGICVGAFLDRLSDPAVDYPSWSTRTNLRFAGNLARRPAYYLKRYGLDYQPFLRAYIKARFARIDRTRHGG
ncbi:MAG: WecB/TagA/CpsF family glycosyltransferase [Xanthomonadales bacterium]|nr:WecB/TagA/CpsF family glycosyltransferase [Xanthomonadales bacterium]